MCIAAAVVFALWLASGGCVPPGSRTPPTDGNRGQNARDFPNLRIEGEPNDTFDLALDVVFDATGLGQLQGTIENADDIDIYRLGELLAGDRMMVDVGTPGSNLDAAVALFDEGGRLVFENDDRAYELGQYDPFVNHVVRHDSLVYYVAITSAPLNAAATTGSYEIMVRVSRGGDVPAPAPQTVVLEFGGGSLSISGTTYTAPPFDTADISSSYAGMTEVVRDQIVATILENYEGFALEVLSIPGDDVPTDCTSRLLLGGRNPSAFGLAEDIDPYNLDPCDNAIIFTDMFSPFRFGRVLTAEELGTAIGNVASHEIGHLLGLNHVSDVLDLMDTTGTASSFLLDQEFATSALHYTIFPIGVQDGVQWLLETLGAAP